MFYNLRRLVLLSAALMLVAGVGLLFRYRNAFQPVADWIEVLKNKKEAPAGDFGEVSGVVTRIHDGDTFTLRDDQRNLHVLSLTGIAAPEFLRNQSKTERARAQRGKDHLAQLILSNRITVALTYATPQRSGLAVARNESTNVNVAVVAAGWAEVRRPHIQSLPAALQVELIQAERHAHTAGLGLWAPSVTSTTTATAFGGVNLKP